MKKGKYYPGKGKYVGVIGNQHYFETENGVHSEQTNLSYIKDNPTSILGIVFSSIALVFAVVSLIYNL